MKTYEQIRGYRPDFVVKYRLYTPAEGGRKVTFQHLRCDFLYDGDDPQKDGIYMIHPEFLTAEGAPLGEDVPVPLEGRASMWILSPEMRKTIHKARAKVGMKGFFVEGPRKVGEVMIDEIVGLHENPTEPSA
jgi:hypothetical protein